MARVTVEDCVDKVPNRYELVMVAAQRTKEIADGSPLAVDRDNDKNTVVALREMADSKVDIPELQRRLVVGLQKYEEVEETAEEEHELMAAEKELSGVEGEFSNLMIDMDEVDDSMQIQDEDSALNLDLDSDFDEDSDLSDADFDDGFDTDSEEFSAEDDAFDDFDE